MKTIIKLYRYIFASKNPIVYIVEEKDNTLTILSCFLNLKMIPIEGQYIAYDKSYRLVLSICHDINRTHIIWIKIQK
jgi:hypothetical protein